MPGEIIAEQRATSNRNGGQDHPGIPGDFRRNQQRGGYMPYSVFFLLILMAAAAPSAWSQTAQSFTLEKGQAIRITPEGKVDIFGKMQGDASHIAEMEKRAQPITKGLAIWIGEDGIPKYLINPVEGAEHFGRH